MQEATARLLIEAVRECAAALRAIEARLPPSGNLLPVAQSCDLLFIIGGDMPTFPEAAGKTLIDGATDGNGDAISVRRINGQIVTAFPVAVPLAQGAVIVAADGSVTFDDAGVTGLAPNVVAAAGSLTFTLWDGIAESAVQTATVSLLGVNSPPVGQDQVLTFNVRARP